MCSSKLIFIIIAVVLNTIIESDADFINADYRTPKAIIDLTRTYMPKGAAFCQNKTKELDEAENRASACVQKHYSGGTFCSIFKGYNADCYIDVVKTYETCLEPEYRDVLKLEEIGQILATEYSCNLSNEKFLEILKPCARNGLDKGLKISLNTINKHYISSYKLDVQNKNYAKIFCQYSDNVFKSIKNEIAISCGEKKTQDVMLGIVKSMIVEPCKRVKFSV